MVKPQKLKKNYNLNCNITLLIFKRNINTKSLSLKSSRMPKETNELNIPNMRSTPDSIDKKIIDDTLKNLNQDSPDLKIRVKRKSPDTSSDQGSSGENTLNKKAKFSHETENENETENDNVTENENVNDYDYPTLENYNDYNYPIRESIEENNLAEIENHMRNLPNIIESYHNRKDETFRLMDEIQVTTDLLEEYTANLKISLEEITETIYGCHLRWKKTDSDNDNDSDDDMSELISENSSVVDTNVGMEPLNNGVSFSDVIYSGQMRIDNITFNNYSIQMSGKDNIDYRMAYEYLTECLENIDRLIAEHETVLTLERQIIPKISDADIQSIDTEIQINDILDILNQLT